MSRYIDINDFVNPGELSLGFMSKAPGDPTKGWPDRDPSGIDPLPKVGQ
jgi:hypothetical protein